MTLNPAELAEKMVGAAMTVLTGKAPSVVSYAKSEFESIAQQIAGIAQDFADGKMSQAEAINLYSQVRNESEQRMIEVKELGELVVEQAINAALDVVKETVNVDTLGGRKRIGPRCICGRAGCIIFFERFARRPRCRSGSSTCGKKKKQRKQRDAHLRYN
jgi:hypothetical protein